MHRPDELALQRDLEGAAFLHGVARGRWRVVRDDGVIVVLAVTARDGTEFGLRFDCNGYPGAAPTAQVWSLIGGAPPASDAEWPSGSGPVAKVFRRDWKGGTALYLPTDRVALAGHTAWPQQHPHLLWNPRIGIAHYLEIVHDLLHSQYYHPPASPDVPTVG